jgi:hypothetical protein
MTSQTPTSPSLGPRFCPACGHEVENAEDGSLCGHCGETLQLQGHCPICERRWRLNVGALCPKHDVPLEPHEPAPSARSRSGQPIAWVTLTKFPHSLAVSAARIRLEAEGIPTFVEGERMGAPAMYQVATDGVKLQVPADLVDDARVILAQNWSLPIDGEDDDIDDDFNAHDVDWDDALPEVSTMRARAVEIILILALLTPLVIWLIVRLHGQ